MNKICTSLEQSKKLVELGIDINTADTFWDMAEPEKRRTPTVGLISDYYDMEDWAIPAWSSDALSKLLPPYLFEFERGIDLNIYPNLNGKGWHCSYMPNCIENMKKDKFKQITNGDTIIDAMFEMIVWLKENNKL